MRTGESDSRGSGARLVLAGAGHAHIQTLRRVREFTERGLEVVVIAPEEFWYSGVGTGILGGQYEPELGTVDVEILVRSGGGLFIRDRIGAIEPARRLVRLEGGGEVEYDALSLNLGSRTRPLPGEDGRVYPIKPL